MTDLISHQSRQSIKIIEEIEHLESEKLSWIHLFKNHPLFGDAYCHSVGILETGNQRLFTKVKYRFPEEKEFRYQAFYLSSGTNTGELGYHVFFPCDGYCIKLVKEGKRSIIQPWIIKLIQTKSVMEMDSSQVKNELAKRFGTPYFAFLSYCMRYKSTVSNIWDDQSLSDILEILKSPFSVSDVKTIQSKVIPFQLIRIGKSIGDRESLINQFIEDALSVNYLRQLPATLGHYKDEYPNRSHYQLNYKDILEGIPFDLYHSHRFKQPHILMILMEDGVKYIPIEAIEMDLKKEGFRFIQYYNSIYKLIYKEILEKMHQYTKTLQRQEKKQFQRRFPVEMPRQEKRQFSRQVTVEASQPELEKTISKPKRKRPLTTLTYEPMTLRSHKKKKS